MRCNKFQDLIDGELIQDNTIELFISDSSMPIGEPCWVMLFAHGFNARIFDTADVLWLTTIGQRSSGTQLGFFIQS